MSQALLIAVVGLLLLPAFARKLRSSFVPAEWARINATSLVAAVVLLEVALVICASPLVLHMIYGGTQRHFFPGGIVAGYVSLIAAVIVPLSIAFGIGKLIAHRRLLRAEPWLGDHRTVDGIDIVVLPTSAELAFSLPGSPPQILISEGLVELLTPDQLRTVLKHEAAHIQFHHSRYLMVVAALAPLFGRVGPVRGSLETLELAIECWADSATAQTAIERSTTKSALLTLTHTNCVAGIAAFSKAQSAAIRIESLSHAPQAPRTRARWFLYSTLGLLSATPILMLWLFAS